MGYRSEVEAVIYGEVEKMTVFLVKHKILNSDAFTDFKEHLKVVEHDVVRSREISKEPREFEQYEVKLKVLHLYGADWKWYPDYRDVKAWHALMKSAAEEGLNYEFARVGEEPDDVEVDRGGEDIEYFVEVFRNTGSPFSDN